MSPRTRIREEQTEDLSFISELELNQFLGAVAVTGTETETSVVQSFADYFPGRGLITAGTGVTVATGTNFIQVSATAGSIPAITSDGGFLTVSTGTNQIRLSTDAIVAGTGVTVVSGANTITISSTATGGGTNAIVGDSFISVGSGSNTINLSADAIVGTAGQITVTSGTNAVTLSFPATVTGTTAQFLTVTGTTGQFGGTVSAQGGTYSTSLTLSGLPVSVVEEVGHNLLINGGFQVSQRLGPTGLGLSSTTPPNNDDTYMLDRWILLSDGNNIAQTIISTAAAPTSGGTYSVLGLVVLTANTKFGFFQPIEARDSWPATGRAVSLQVKLNNDSGASTLTNARAAIVGWTGTEDVLTSDIVSAWNVQGTNPTLVANWTYLNTPTNLVLGNPTGVFALNKIENIAVPTNVRNLGVFIWSDDTAVSVSSVLAIAEVKLEIGTRCTVYRERPVALERELCQRFYCTTIPATHSVNNNSTSLASLSVYSSATAAGSVRAIWRFPVEMRVAPTITTYNPSTGTAGGWNRAGTIIAATTANIGSSGATIVSNATTTAGAIHIIHAAASAEL